MINKLSDFWQTPDWLFNELNKEFNFRVKTLRVRVPLFTRIKCRALKIQTVLDAVVKDTEL